MKSLITVLQRLEFLAAQEALDIIRSYQWGMSYHMTKLRQGNESPSGNKNKLLATERK